ncbi:MAG: hypothetical protein AB1714_14340 [Acidobacteriota bacterium]
MAFEDILRGSFGKVLTETSFVKRSYNTLKDHGFTDDNSIASVCVCRDEISQPIRSAIRSTWGEAFNLSSLGAMFTAGKTGLRAAMNHSPQVEGKERYIFYILPHIAIDEQGTAGSYRRRGSRLSSACGALCQFLAELRERRVRILMDEEDVEESLLKRRLVREIPWGEIPELIPLTEIARRVSQSDLEHALYKVVDFATSDTAVLTGIQIHGPESNYVAPRESYLILNGQRQELRLV